MPMRILSCAVDRIPFQQAIKLLASRAVYLEAGFAYVPLQRLEAIIIMKVTSYIAFLEPFVLKQ